MLHRSWARTMLFLVAFLYCTHATTEVRAAAIIFLHIISISSSVQNILNSKESVCRGNWHLVGQCQCDTAQSKSLCLPLPVATRHYALPSLHMSIRSPFGFHRTDVQSCINECLQNGKYVYKNTQHAYRKWWKTGLGAFSGATWKGWLLHLCNLHK